MSDKMQAAAPDWSPAEPGRDGIFLDAHDLPLNHRLRAEALVKAGVGEDPGGEIPAELIAETAARLKARAEAAAGAAKPLAEQTGKQLRATAAAEQIPLPVKGKNAELVAEIERVRAERASAATDEGTTGQ